MKYKVKWNIEGMKFESFTKNEFRAAIRKARLIFMYTCQDDRYVRSSRAKALKMLEAQPDDFIVTKARWADKEVLLIG